MDKKQPTKFYEDFASFKNANAIMNEFQVLHNVLRSDYLKLLSITESMKEKRIEFNVLYRACLVQLFTTIESDLFGLRTLDPYPTVNKKTNFFDVFTKTFNQIGKTWGKEEIIQRYLANHFGELMSIKNERNKLVHPKKVEDIIVPTYTDLDRLRNAFNEYNLFMGEITNGFLVGLNFITFEQLNEIQKQTAERGITLASFTINNIEMLDKSKQV